MKGKFLTVYEEDLAADLRSLDLAQKLLVRWTAKCQLEEDEVFQWKLILTEAVTNAIRHGCGGIPGAVIHLSLEIGDQHITMSVQQPGPGPDIQSVQQVSLPDDPLSEGGRGLFIISNYADKVTHWHNPDGYRIVIRKDYTKPLTGTVNHEMGKVLSELTSAYESLTAYNRLGQQLLAHQSVSSYFIDTIEHLQVGHPYQKILICPTGHLPDSLQKLSLANEVITKRAIRWEGPPKAIFWHGREEKPEIVRGIVPEADYGMITPVFCQDLHLFDAVVTFQSEDSMSSQAVNLFRSVAELLGLSVGLAILEQKREAEARRQREWEIATQLELSLLPILPRHEERGINIALFHESADEIGGDYAMIYRNPSNHKYLYVTMIDVMGKGVRAALLAVLYRGMFQVIARESPSPQTILDVLNKIFCNILGDMVYFITALVLRIDKRSGKLEWSNAGHCDLLGFTGQDCICGKPSGPPLGIARASTYINESWDLPSLKRLALFTDGCYEWQTGAGLYEMENLRDFLFERVNKPPESVWDEMRQMIRRESVKDVMGDDLTMVICDLDLS